MGDQDDRHRRRIDRSFALASKEVTVEQFLQFRKDHRLFKDYAPGSACPVNDVSWYDAVAYCNWLSAREGLPPDQWCYEPNASGDYAEGMKMAANYLQRTGYRLPTEAEWEYACRAGSDTPYFFGATHELLGKYSWTLINSIGVSRPVGTSRPNDFGFFDLLGNASEWCQSLHAPFRTDTDPEDLLLEDREDVYVVNNQQLRAVRGGSFFHRAQFMRVETRQGKAPSFRLYSYAFRVARTVAP
jgi:formylglycine-generating enzyme required for sulfatase activity